MMKFNRKEVYIFICSGWAERSLSLGSTFADFF